MAKRRMFSLDVVDTDAFLDMPLSSQALYFHLGMRADDDGFLANPKRILRDLGASGDDMRILLAKRFVLTFESGVVVIKHWKMNNYIQSDRHTETKWTGELDRLIVKKNGAYSEKARPVYTKKSQIGYTGKVRLGKERLVNNIASKGDVSKLASTNNQEIDINEIDEEIEKIKATARN